MDKFNNYNLNEDEIDIVEQIPNGFLNAITRKANAVQQDHLRERGFWKRKVRRLKRIIQYMGGDVKVTQMYLFGAFLAFIIPWFIHFDTIFF